MACSRKAWLPPGWVSIPLGSAFLALHMLGHFCVGQLCVRHCTVSHEAISATAMP